MNRVLLSTLLVLTAACSSKSDSSTGTTTPPGDSTAMPGETAETTEAETTEPTEGTEPGEGTEPAAAGDFKNLQVLPSTISKADLKAAMKNVSTGLGVQCDFCHVDEDMASDANPHKVAARSMLSMTMELNKDYFGGKPEVKCMTCHKGKEKPTP